MRHQAPTVDAYLASLPEDRRAAISAVRDAIRSALDTDYEESVSDGMIGYSVPHRVFPAGYHASPTQPLPFASLASQKRHMALYLMGLYVGAGGADVETPEAKWFREAWAATGRKLDMGRCCVRFKTLDDVPLEVVAEAMRRLPSKKYIARYTAMLAAKNARRAAGRPAGEARGKAAGTPVRRTAGRGAKPRTPAPSRAVDAYLAALSPDKRAPLERLRTVIRAAAPGAEECISYQLPAFRLDAKYLVAYGPAAKHYALYPGSAAIQAHRVELKGYDTSKGTVRFPLDKPLPAALVRKLVKARIAAIRG